MTFNEFAASSDHPSVTSKQRNNWPKTEHLCRYCQKPMLAYHPSSAVCSDCKQHEDYDQRLAEKNRHTDDFLRGGLNRVLRSAGMSPLELDCFLDQVDPILMQEVQDLVDNFVLTSALPEWRTKGFGLSGPTGVGKTGLMAALTKDWAERAGLRVLEAYGHLRGDLWRPYWAGWPATVDHLRSLARDLEARNEFMRRLKRAPLLVIDDLGKEEPSALSRERFFEIVDHRSQHRKAILWTSSRTQPQLVDQYGEDTISRLIEIAPGVKTPNLPNRRKRHRRSA